MSAVQWTSAAGRACRLLLLALALASCGDAPEPSEPATAGQRVALAHKILDHAPPSPILDAHFLAEPVGAGGWIGPTDYRYFLHLKVAPAEIGRWTAAFRALEVKPAYAAPAEARPWWVSPQTFGALEFYHPAPLSRLVYGWLGVSRATGEIYLFTVTM